MALTDDQKDVLNEKADEMMLGGNGFNTVYEKYLQDAIRTADIDSDDIEMAEEHFREKIKELI